MAETKSVADRATHAPTSADLERVAKFTREPFVTDVVINTDYDPSRMLDHLYIAPSLPFLRR